MTKKRRTTTPAGAAPPQPPQPDHLDELLDEAESESFPASDPIAVTPRRQPVQLDHDAPGRDPGAEDKPVERPGGRPFTRS